jgi:hypothetical protein
VTRHRHTDSVGSGVVNTCFLDPPNELSPTFSESGALFGRELGLLECRGVAGTERLKCEACFFPVNPCSRRVGPEISHPVSSRFRYLGEDSRNKLKCVEGLALRMGEQRVVVGAFALVEQCLGTGRPMNA